MVTINIQTEWREESIKEFTKGLFPTRITYHVWGYPDAAVRTRITDHADPAAFMPYVHAVAQHVVAGFQALVPHRK
ncbi:hypothetical protein [Streptomyces hirsutus]|uniref:hypothetical protein n=1 Tax=Streptomyces hirsutus TaxID=35620 RepID=UPI00369D3405